MDGIVLSHTSAEKVLEREVLKQGYGLEPTSHHLLPSASSLMKFLGSEGYAPIDGITFPYLDVLVSSQKEFRRHDNIVFHQWSGELPPNGIQRIADPYSNELYIASAPFLALIAARNLPLTNLAQYIMYLCGYYCIHQKVKLEERRPLTNKDEIAQMLKYVRGTMGWRRLFRVLPYCAEGVRSPQEANYYIVVTFPCELGGYQFTKPKVNASIPLEEKYQALTNSPSIEVDFYWEDAGVVVEYNGLENHEGGISPLDITQQIILQEKGIEVIFFTKEQLYNAELLDLAMRQLAIRLGNTTMAAWPDMKNVRMLTRSLNLGNWLDLRSTPPDLLKIQKRWIRRQE